MARSSRLFSVALISSASLLCATALAQGEPAPSAAVAASVSAPSASPPSPAPSASASSAPRPVAASSASPPATPPLEGARDVEGADGLLADLQRIVEAEEAAGWFHDASSVQAVYPTVLQTVCRATPSARDEARRRLDEQQAQAGDARLLFAQAGRKLSSDAARALTVSRKRLLLAKAQASTEQDCPFWIEPSWGFIGRQTDSNRFTLNLETGGLVQFRRMDGAYTYGGGGVARLLGGYGFGGSLSLMLGGEFAGGAMLVPGSSTAEFAINYFIATPAVLRIYDGNWMYDGELAFVSLFQADDTRFSFGGRLGLGIGVRALKTRFFVPWAGIAGALEHYVPSGGRSATQFLRGGLRVGFTWDP